MAPITIALSPLLQLNFSLLTLSNIANNPSMAINFGIVVDANVAVFRQIIAPSLRFKAVQQAESVPFQ